MPIILAVMWVSVRVIPLYLFTCVVGNYYFIQC